MTQRSILAGANPEVIIKAGASVTVKGREGDRVAAETNGNWGLKLERKKGKVEVQIGGSGEVWVPMSSNVKVYAGKNIHVQGLKGEASGFAGLDLVLKDVKRLGNASAGGAMEIDCQSMHGRGVTFSAGRDLRFHVKDLTSARLRVKDIGGYWEARIGRGEVEVYLKSGGDVTVLTDQDVQALPPDYILGRIEKPDNGL
ncbi:MAG: hypothetical protein EHM70_03920 [Chloroflexota bacterium]|nr:MAG: hypothetical protein EHM70_03920 [Chloroflexota bacterium]